MAAVSAFVARRPKPREAALFGVRWAIGHGFSLFILGSVLYLAKRAAEASQPTLFASGALDRFVGVVLIGLGGWTLFQVVSHRAAKHHHHGHFHDGHLHTHDPAPLVLQEARAKLVESKRAHTHREDIASLGMGVLHGAAGTGAFAGQAAVSLSSSYSFVFLYTLMFSVGVLISMGLYAGALGGLITSLEKRGNQALTAARVATGCLACGIGACLVTGVELPGLFDRLMH
jgi:hypothetical protein